MKNNNEKVEVSELDYELIYQNIQYYRLKPLLKILLKYKGFEHEISAIKKVKLSDKFMALNNLKFKNIEQLQNVTEPIFEASKSILNKIEKK